MTDPIIFLDFDGVLNSDQYFESPAYNKEADTSSATYAETVYLNMVDPKAVANLNIIIAETGAKVVVSSVWRKGRTIEQLQEILNKKGFKGKVIDKTPNSSCADCVRGNDIRKWQKVNGAEDSPYVILDDDRDMLYWQRNHFIHIDSTVGLTEKNAHLAIAYLRTTYPK